MQYYSKEEKEKDIDIICYVIEDESNGIKDVKMIDKRSSKVVSLSGSNLDLGHLSLFLNMTRFQHDVMPTIYEPDGSDIVVVHGRIKKETEEKLKVTIDVDGGGYNFGTVVNGQVVIPTNE